jgi:hypothetical protein
VRRIASLCSLFLVMTAAAASGAPASSPSSGGSRLNKASMTSLVWAAPFGTSDVVYSSNRQARTNHRTTKRKHRARVALLGNRVIESTVHRNLVGTVEAFAFRADRSGTATSISVYLDERDRATTLFAGLYSSRHGHPQALLTSGVLRSTKPGAWNLVAVNSASVRSGRTYWLAVLGKGGAIYFRDRTGGSCAGEKASKRKLRSLPSTWPAGPKSHVCRISAYVKGVVGASPATGGSTPVFGTNGLDNGPAITGAPTVSGTNDISSFSAPQLVATTGSWSGSPSSYTLQWEDCNSSGGSCQSGQGVAFGPGASGSACSITTALYGCSYNLTANEYDACPASGGSGACDIKLVVTATNASGSTPDTVNVGTVTDSGSSNPWPNFSNTGYQNAPANFDGYGNASYAQATGGTEGVPNPSLLTVASSGSSKCPTSFQSNHTYSGCWYKNPCTPGANCGGLSVSGSNIHFVGDLFSANPNGPVGGCGSGSYCDDQILGVNCTSDCTFDYDTFAPADLSVPDMPMPGHTTTGGSGGRVAGHGTTYADGYGQICACGGYGVTIDHSDAWGWGSGIVFNGANTSATPDLFQDDWLHDQADCEQDSHCTEHTDGIGNVETGGQSEYVTLNHNNMPFIEGNTNDVAFQSATYNYITITNNVLSGDGYTLAMWASSTNTTFTGNVWTNYAQQYYGVNYGQSFWTQSGSTWAHNKFEWDPTGVTPFYQLGPGSGDADRVVSADNGRCWVPRSAATIGNALSTTDYGGGGC